MWRATTLLRATFAQQRNYIQRFASTLVIADHDNKKLNEATLHTITAASKVSDNTITVLVAGHSCKGVAEEVSQIANVKEVLHADDGCIDHFGAERYSALVTDLIKTKKYSHVMTGSTAVGKDVLPRVGGQLETQPLSDITEVIDNKTFVRPFYAGNCLQKVKFVVEDKPFLMTVRSTAFEKAVKGSAKAPVTVASCAAATAVPDNKASKWISDDLSVSERPPLSSARIVVSGGRGMKSGENFKMLEEMADKLGGAVGASRAAVDAGFVPNDMQIGQTGKVVAPELYIAVGISGAIQHLAGMKDSKTIVAINKDADAPIFQVADIGIVGDLFKIVPEMNEKIKKK